MWRVGDIAAVLTIDLRRMIVAAGCLSTVGVRRMPFTLAAGCRAAMGAIRRPGAVTTRGVAAVGTFGVPRAVAAGGGFRRPCRWRSRSRRRRRRCRHRRYVHSTSHRRRKRRRTCRWRSRSHRCRRRCRASSVRSRCHPHPRRCHHICRWHPRTRLLPRRTRSGPHVTKRRPDRAAVSPTRRRQSQATGVSCRPIPRPGAPGAANLIRLAPAAAVETNVPGVAGESSRQSLSSTK